MQFPYKIHYSKGFVPVTDPCEIEILRKQGNDVLVSSGIARQHRVSNVAEFQLLATRYQQLARDINMECVFRGQTRDYFVDGKLTVLPTAFRQKGTPFSESTTREVVEMQLRPWLTFLDETLQLDIGYSLTYCGITEDGCGIVRFQQPQQLSKEFSSELLLGILQHYGFPTYCLDVTQDPLIAAWFALHVSMRSPEGRISYSRIPSADIEVTSSVARAQELAHLPSVHVYLRSIYDSIWVVIDLRENPKLQQVAIRASHQLAKVLPFKKTSIVPSSYGWQIYERNCYWCPSAIIKLHFGADLLEAARPDLTSPFLLPKDDWLYQALVAAKVPHLALYTAD